ncbi:MAG: alpha-L-fucosidase [Kiritimatiellae bacterium]|nr:alpha-L-fucosidase [Kiritimatiellia bacterium]MDD5522064.1 alpha-L-fucosidase [Kiritimatiellia bacterium]
MRKMTFTIIASIAIVCVLATVLTFTGCVLCNKGHFSKNFFQPTDESLKQYKYPDWFRDAKFGIWAHWGPQAVPMDGDWYARGMYEEKNRHYKYHLENYGHPSEFGYKDIIPLWKAEKWDPDRLMSLYKKAGAKYFVSMGCHHDNFDLWNSKHHKWNAVNMGPERDVVGDWKKAAQKYGLRFGVSEHMGASFTWFQSAHRSDKTGPKAGVPYDGANEKYWDLYHKPADTNDKSWYSNNPEWHEEWYKRITDLIDNYQLDLLYTDGGLPFTNDVGRRMIAHLYNKDIETRGCLEVVYNCKQDSEGKWIQDLERGVMPGINPYPWQTDTSIGDWYYNRNWKAKDTGKMYRSAKWVVHSLVDITSKNGNLLLNVVQRPDGSLDTDAEQILEEMAVWVKIYGEAIFGTRPWLVYGEGPVRAKGGHFKEDFEYTSKDIRFTTKGKTLYAIALGWPADGQLVIKSLAKPAGEDINKIRSVNLLGYDGKIEWTQTVEGLIVKVPAQKISEYTCALRITGKNLKPVKFDD